MTCAEFSISTVVFRLKQRGADLVYRWGKGHTHDNEPLQSDKYLGKLVLTPLTARADRPHCSIGAATTHAPAPLLRRAGTELALARGGYGNGAGVKRVMDWHQMSMRGLDKARGEWSLMTIAWNIKRLHLRRAA